MPFNQRFLTTLAEVVIEHLGSDFISEVADTVGRNIDTSDILDRAMSDIDTDDIAENVAEKVAANLPGRIEDDIFENVCERIIEEINVERLGRQLVSALLEDDEFKDKIIDAIMGEITEPRVVHIEAENLEPVDSSVSGLMRTLGLEEENIERRITAPQIEVAHSETSTPVRACPVCGGSMFIHIDGRCPMMPANVNGEYA